MLASIAVHLHWSLMLVGATYFMFIRTIVTESLLGCTNVRKHNIPCLPESLIILIFVDTWLDFDSSK